MQTNPAIILKSGLTALALGLGFGQVATASAAEPVQSVTPADVAAPTEMASRELLATPTPKLGMFRVAGFELLPRAWSSLVYDDNITLQPEATAQSDLIWSLSPGVTVLGGDAGVAIPLGTSFEGLRARPRQPDLAFSGQPAKMLLLNYAPTFKVYTDHDQYSAINESAQFTGIYSFSRLILGLDQDYVKSQDATFDVGALVTSQVFTTRLTSMYQVNDRMSVEVNGRYLNTSYEDPRYTGSRQWENQNWVNRQMTGKINAGLGLALGYWDVDRSGSQTYEQVVVRALYLFAGKMDLSATVGGEWRQFSSGVSATWYPIFRIGANYRPVDATTISVEAHQLQVVSASAGNQNYLDTGFSCSLRQRLFDKWFATVSGGYGLADYQATQPGVLALRSDTYYSARFGMDYQFSERWTVGAYYQHQGDASNVTYDYNDNQIGVKGSWQY